MASPRNQWFIIGESICSPWNWHGKVAVGRSFHPSLREVWHAPAIGPQGHTAIDGIKLSGQSSENSWIGECLEKGWDPFRIPSIWIQYFRNPHGTFRKSPIFFGNFSDWNEHSTDPGVSKWPATPMPASWRRASDRGNPNCIHCIATWHTRYFACILIIVIPPAAAECFSSGPFRAPPVFRLRIPTPSWKWSVSRRHPASFAIPAMNLSICIWLNVAPYHPRHHPSSTHFCCLNLILVDQIPMFLASPKINPPFHSKAPQIAPSCHFSAQKKPIILILILILPIVSMSHIIPLSKPDG